MSVGPPTPDGSRSTIGAGIGVALAVLACCSAKLIILGSGLAVIATLLGNPYVIAATLTALAVTALAAWATRRRYW